MPVTLLPVMARLPLALLCVLAALHTMADTTNTVARLTREYAQAKTEVEKRTVCLRLIDAGLLYVGSPVRDLQTVFQRDFEEMGLDTQSNKTAIVHFVAPRPSSDPLASAVWTGWYLSVSYRPDGAVIHYSLSNESKITSMRLLYERQIKEGRGDQDPGPPRVNEPKDGRKNGK